MNALSCDMRGAMPFTDIIAACGYAQLYIGFQITARRRPKQKPALKWSPAPVLIRGLSVNGASTDTSESESLPDRMPRPVNDDSINTEPLP